jgi:hypothetical protein
VASLAQINIRFFADIEQFSSQMQNVSRQIKKVGKQVKRVGKNFSLGLTAPFVAFSAISLKNWDAQTKAISQVENGLKSTENAAGITLDRLQELASGLQDNSLYGDEQILQKVTTQLLTFTNIVGNEFERTQAVALDLSAKLGTDLQSSAIQLGKALNDPVSNLSALSRSGIQFSNEQKKLIKSLANTNRLSEAQGIILDELERQYGGTAKAVAEAGLGPFKQIQNILGDVTEEFGAMIAKAILPFTKYLKTLVQRLRDLDDSTKKTILIVGGLAAVIGPLLIALGFLMTNIIPGLITVFVGLRTAVSASVTVLRTMAVWAASNPLGALVIGVAAIVSYFLIFNKESDKVIEKQSLLSKITEKATKSIAKEKARLTELVAIAKDESISKTERIKAIREINKISPKYLGDLTLETIGTDKARLALEKYNKQLIQVAKIKAAQAKLEEIETERLDLELRQAQSILLYQKNKKEALFEEKKVRDVLIEQNEQMLALGKQHFEQRFANLKEEEELILDIIKANRLNTQAIEQTSNSLGNLQRKKGEPLSTLEPVGLKPIISGLENDSEAIDVILTTLGDRFLDFSDRMTSALKTAATNVFVGMGEIVAGLFSGTVTMGDVAGLLLKTIGDLAIQLGRAAIEIGVGMLAIKSAFKNPFTAIAAGIALVAVGTLIKGVATNFSGDDSSPRPFASGGIVFGPTNALIGEYAGARRNPEIVAPLDRLTDLISPANQSVEVLLSPGIEFSGRKMKFFLSEIDKRLDRTR